MVGGVRGLAFFDVRDGIGSLERGGGLWDSGVVVDATENLREVLDSGLNACYSQ